MPRMLFTPVEVGGGGWVSAELSLTWNPAKVISIPGHTETIPPRLDWKLECIQSQFGSAKGDASEGSIVLNQLALPGQLPLGKLVEAIVAACQRLDAS